jgi:hypothetical protein
MSNVGGSGAFSDLVGVKPMRIRKCLIESAGELRHGASRDALCMNSAGQVARFFQVDVLWMGGIAFVAGARS